MEENKANTDIQEKALTDITLELLKQSGKESKLIKLSACILIGLMLLINAFVIYTNFLWQGEIMEYMATMETTDGDSAINNVSGSQYTDSATHNSSGE